MYFLLLGVYSLKGREEMRTLIKDYDSKKFTFTYKIKSTSDVVAYYDFCLKKKSR